jgi:hypothetical protein
MSEAAILKLLHASAEAQRILEGYFDFLPVSSTTKSSLFKFRKDTSYELVGKDKSGGEFALCDSHSLMTRPMLYASSEGQAGIIARSLEGGLSCIIDLPYWQDCLKFSGGGQLVEMRRAVPLAECDILIETPQIASSRIALRKLLGLSEVPDSIGELFSAITELSPIYTVCGSDGSEFESLFGRFTVMSNGAWRRRLDSQP